MAAAPTQSNKKLLIVGIVLTLTFGLSLLVWRWTQSLQQPVSIPENTKRPSYNQLNISKDNDVVAIIRHQDNALSFEATDPVIQAQLLVNLKIWERQQLEYPTGGQLADGTLWDGAMMTDVTKSDFLIAIWMLLEEKLGESYSYDLQP